MKDEPKHPFNVRCLKNISLAQFTFRKGQIYGFDAMGIDDGKAVYVLKMARGMERMFPAEWFEEVAVEKLPFEKLAGNPIYAQNPVFGSF